MLSMISIPVTTLAVGLPRSGLSRSDLVHWPDCDMTVALINVRFRG